MLLSVSHNLKTPLNSIRLTCKAMLNAELVEDKREKLQIIYDNQIFLNSMISDLLDYNSIE